MNNKSFINNYILPIIMIILIIIVWKSSDFLKSSIGILSRIFENRLNIKVNPMIIGGEIASSFNDDIMDNEIYPLIEINDIKNGYQSTDIITYNVHYPLSVFGDDPVWNLTLEFRELEFDQYTSNNFKGIKAVVYIDLNDNEKDGGTSSFYDDEKMKFQNDFKWDYFIEFDYLHENGLMHSYSTKKTYPVDLSYFKNNNSIRVSLPVVEKINKKMDKQYMGRHIVLVGFYSPFEQSGLLTKIDKEITPYYDMLCNDTNIDGKILALSPVEINNPKTKDYNNELEQVLKKTNELKDKEYENKYPIDKIINNELIEAKSYYDENMYNEAELILNNFKDDSSIANIYLGSIYAKKAGSNTLSITQKMNLVNDAYRFFDKAEKLLKNDTELYYLLNSRFQVSMSVPDDVFGKLDQAKNDLLKLVKMNISKEEKAGYYSLLIDIAKKRNNIRDLRILENEIKREFDFRD